MLSEWFDEIFKVQGITIWLDTKDVVATALGYNMSSKFPTRKFIHCLIAEETRLCRNGIKVFERIFVGCQWEWLRKNVLKYSPRSLRIIHDLPYTGVYILDRLVYSNPDTRTQSRILRSIRRLIKADRENADLVSFDKMLFGSPKQASDFLNRLPPHIKICILYSYQHGEEVPVWNRNGAELIIQYDYKWS